MTQRPGARKPLYARALRLRYIQPGAVLCAIFFEGSVALAVLLSLAELVNWWSVLLLPGIVAAFVKVNDWIKGAYARSDVTRRIPLRRRSSARGVAPVRRGEHGRHEDGRGEDGGEHGLDGDGGEHGRGEDDRGEDGRHEHGRGEHGLDEDGRGEDDRGEHGRHEDHEGDGLDGPTEVLPTRRRRKPPPNQRRFGPSLGTRPATDHDRSW